MSDTTQSPNSYMPVLISACLLLMLSFGLRSGFGLFLQPMSEANGWGRDVLALALAIQNLSWGVSAVIAGGFVNRFGTTKVLLGGIALYGLGTLGMASSTTALSANLTAGVIIGAGIAGTSFGIVLPAIARAVPAEKQGWALGIGTAAGSAGQFLIVPAAQVFIDWLGWLGALQLMGLLGFGMAVFVIPLARYGNEAGAAPAGTAEISLWQLTRRALAVRSYVLLLVGFYVCGYHLAFITVHMPGYVVDLGFTPQVGAWSIGTIGLCNIFGAYYSGVASGKRPKHTMLSAIYTARAIAILAFLLLPPSLFSILGFSAAMGFPVAFHNPSDFGSCRTVFWREAYALSIRARVSQPPARQLQRGLAGWLSIRNHRQLRWHLAVGRCARTARCFTPLAHQRAELRSEFKRSISLTLNGRWPRGAAPNLA